MVDDFQLQAYSFKQHARNHFMALVDFVLDYTGEPVPER